MTNDELSLLQAKLKQGDYDGADIMSAWLAIDELIDLRNRFTPERVAALAQAKARMAPWLDWAESEILEGDVIEHAKSGERGRVVFLPDEKEPSDQWRVDYGRPGRLSRLVLQIGDRGQASVIRGPGVDSPWV